MIESYIIVNQKNKKLHPKHENIKIAPEFWANYAGKG